MNLIGTEAVRPEPVAGSERDFDRLSPNGVGLGGGVLRQAQDERGVRCSPSCGRRALSATPTGGLAPCAPATGEATFNENSAANGRDGHKVRRVGLLTLLIVWLGIGPAWAGGGPETTLLVVNADSAISRVVAQEYIRLRELPERQVVWLEWHRRGRTKVTY